MKTYRINFVANFDVDIQAANGSEARQKADEMCKPVRFWPGFAERNPVRCCWNHIARIDGADDD